MNYHRAEIIILENALREAISSVEFMHECLTNPDLASYTYPEQTTEKLSSWKKLVGPLEYCHHSSFVADCQACQLWKFIRPAGHNCKVSTGINDCLTFGSGELDYNGFWENGCYECARAHEEQFPGEACWPHTQEWIDGKSTGEQNG